MRTDLVRDQRGAVMLTGVFMGAFLIGATWLCFGIARAAVFRERVQETADSAAFSSAAIHAKGMNLIAAINLVFFAITAIWLTLRILEKVLQVVQTVIGNSTNCHGAFCHLRNPCEVREIVLDATVVLAEVGEATCKVAYALQEVRDVEKEARQKVGDAMDRFFPPLSKVQDVTARLAPVAGTAMAVGLGGKFGHATIAVSPSLVPLNDIVRGATGSDEHAVETPLGLPVVPKKFGTLCNRAAKIVLLKIKDGFGAIPLIGKLIELPLVKQAVDTVIDMGSDFVEKEFCGDKASAGHNESKHIFKEKGPKEMFEHASNGSDHMQVWAFTNGSMSDVDAPRVAVAGKNYNAKATSTSNTYIAQGEFYFDCKGGWEDSQCNGATGNAMYNMKWRARLRRLKKPSLGAELGQYLKDAMKSGPVKDAVKGKADKPGESSEEEEASAGFGERMFDKGYDWLVDKGAEATGVGSNGNGTVSGAFH